MRIPRVLTTLALVWTSLFLFACVALPLFALLVRADASADPALLLDPVVLSIARFTAWQAFLSTLLSIVIALPLGVAVGALIHRSSMARLSQIALVFPFGVPTVVVGMAGVTWLGRSGVLADLGWHVDWLYSLEAVVLAHVFLNAPWLSLLISQARSQQPGRFREAAQSLGAGWFRRFILLDWPYVRWTLLSGSAQVFTLCAMSFALVLLLGGGPPVQTLETAIYSRIRYSMLDVSGAVACALWQLVIALLPWSLVLILRFKGDPALARLPVETPVLRARPSRWKSKFWPVVPFVISLLGVLPYLVLFKAETVTFLTSAEKRELWLDPLWVSIQLAVAAPTLALLTASAGVLAARRLPVLALLLAVPSGISVLVLGLGFWLAYSEWIDPFEGSFLSMIVLQATLFLPVAFRALWPLSEGTQRGLLEVAVTLGATPWRAFWQVEWPRWRAPVLGVFGILAAASLGEVAAVSLFFSEELIPLPLLITRWMAQYRFDDAQAVAALLLILSAGTIGVIGAAGLRGGGAEGGGAGGDS